MNGIDLTAILPLIVLGGTVTIVMLAIAFCRNHRLTALLSVLGSSFVSSRSGQRAPWPRARSRRCS
jgi:hypothetical protein